jgi:carbon-monoxide dehydrogenase small subunit
MSTRRASGPSTTDESRLEIPIAIAPGSLWHALKDIDTVVRCIPGASLAGPPNADPLSLDMTVAIGPMQARFEGSAHVAFDDRRHEATIEGSGHDVRSRSTGQGRIELAVRPSEAGDSILRLRLHYALKGPLAQFGRGAVVDAVVEQLLERFTANLVSAAAGKEVDSSPPLGGLGLAVAAFRRWLRRWLTHGDH